MSEFFKVALSLSLSGSLLIVIIILCCRLFGNRLSKRWQYYIWLVVVLRLLIPLSPEVSIFGAAFGEHSFSSVNYEADSATVYEIEASGAVSTEASEETPRQSPLTMNALKILNTLPNYLWPPWLLIAIALVIRKITLYQSFAKYIKAGKTEVSDRAIMNILGDCCEKQGIQRPVELYINNLISSPIIMGFFNPRIVLPSIPAGELEFRYICLHELTHYKRGDIFYKWLLQITLCLHWFNPFVHLMVRKANRACELSCDESLIYSLDIEERAIYGDTLLESLKTPGEYREGIAALTLSENAFRIKERLAAIKNFRKSTKGMVVIAAVLTISFCLVGFTLGSYTPIPVTALSEPNGGELSDEGLPIMSAANRNVYEKYIEPVTTVGLLRKNFSPEDTYALVEHGGMGLLTIVQALKPEEFEKNSDYYQYIPASFADTVLTTYLPLRQEQIRQICAEIYDSESDTYRYFGGLGGGPAIPIVTQFEKDVDLLTVRYTWYISDPAADRFQYNASDSGELIIRLSRDSFQYISNRVIPAG